MGNPRMRTALKLDQGLGSAKKGVAHWWIQRMTAIALIPLTLWFVGSLMAVADSNYSTVTGWFKNPFTTILMVSLLIAVFYHIALGLRVVVEDYVHVEGVKIAAVMTMNFACFALAATGIYATLRIAFGA